MLQPRSWSAWRRAWRSGPAQRGSRRARLPLLRPLHVPKEGRRTHCVRAMCGSIKGHCIAGSSELSKHKCTTLIAPPRDITARTLCPFVLRSAHPSSDTLTLLAARRSMRVPTPKEEQNVVSGNRDRRRATPALIPWNSSDAPLDEDGHLALEHHDKLILIVAPLVEAERADC